MTAYTWSHLQCNGCPAVLTTASTKDGTALPGTSTAAKAGWRTRRASATQRLPRRDYCPACIKAGRSA